MFVFWIIIGGLHSTEDVFIAAFSTAFVSLISYRHFTKELPKNVKWHNICSMLKYLLWLSWQVVIANYDTIRYIYGAKINPHVFTFAPKIKTDYGLVILSNSITVTPGTVVIDAEKHFMVHAISEQSAASLQNKTLEKRILKVEKGLSQ